MVEIPEKSPKILKQSLCLSLLLSGTFLSGGLLSGCSSDIASAIKLSPAQVWLQEVQFKVGAQMNNNAPVSVRVVIAHNDEVLTELGKLTAAQYFEREATLKADHVGDCETVAAEIVPGQKNDPIHIELSNVNSVGALVFCRYSTPGPHRHRIGTDRIVRLELGKTDFSVTTIKP
jgi:type VI secretion system protein